MKTEIKNIYRVAVAATIAVLFAATTVLAGINVAYSAPASTIDPDQKGSITIHKYLYSGIGNTPTGNEGATVPADAQALENVKFKIEKVTLSKPITTQEGLKEALALDINTIPSTDLTLVEEVTTGTDGTITTTKPLDLGVYKVTELDSPNVTPAPPGGLIPAKPFLVYVPMTNPENNSEWNYNVHVYPKNESDVNTKTVSDASKQVGDQVTFTITGRPQATADDNITKTFAILDTFDPTKLKVKETDISISYEGLPSSVDGSWIPTSAVKTYDDLTQALRVEWKDENLTKIVKYANDYTDFKVKVIVNAKVLPVGDGDGVIKNKATIITNKPDSEQTVEKETNETQTNYGKLKIRKIGADTKKGQEATFQVYYCDGATNKTIGDPLSINGETSFTTNEGTGEAIIDGLHTTERENDKEVQADDQRAYCLVETESSYGYSLLAEPVRVEFTKDGLDVSTATKTVEIENERDTWFNLPKTGGPGIIIMIIAGVAIVAGGAVYGLRSRKSNE